MVIYVYDSEVFQCPTTGVPVWLQYDSENKLLMARIAIFEWSALKDKAEYYATNVLQLEVDTMKWCKEIKKRYKTLDEANKFAEQFGVSLKI